MTYPYLVENLWERGERHPIQADEELAVIKREQRFLTSDVLYVNLTALVFITYSMLKLPFLSYTRRHCHELLKEVRFGSKGQTVCGFTTKVPITFAVWV